MRMCQACHEQEAVVRLTEIVGDDVTTVHLCSQCAAARGIDTEAEVAQTPLGAFLAAMNQGPAAMDLDADPTESAAMVDVACPNCRATLQEFRASGRVGCAQCWSVFERPLADLLRRLQGAAHHRGKMYHASDAGTEPPTLSVRDQREVLREALQLAVAAEQFERAAGLRDRLRELDAP